MIVMWWSHVKCVHVCPSRGDVQGQGSGGMPTAPERDSSLYSPVTKDDELLYLAGRKPYTYPTGPKTGQQMVIGSSNTTGGEGVGLGGGALDPMGGMDRLFNGSSVSLAISEDSMSLHSANSDAITPEGVRRSATRPTSAPSTSQGALKPNSAPRPESPNPSG